MIINEHMIKIFHEYVKEDVFKIEIKESNYEEFNDYRKYAFINDAYIIKAYKNNYNTPHQVEGYGDLMNRLKASGASVPKMLKNKDSYLTKYTFDHGEFLVWCEELLPYETFTSREEFGKDFYHIMGTFLGEMHFISREKQLSYTWPSAMVLFETFSEEDTYDENYENAKSFYDGLKATAVNQDLLDEIWSVYNDKRNTLKSHYKDLPFGAVQGDLSFVNILKDQFNNPVAVIDFNQSGNDRYVNDMMHWAIYFAYGQERDTHKLREFFSGYKQFYNLNNHELENINRLYNIISPFRYYDSESKVIELAKDDIELANKYLQQVLYELKRDDIRNMIEG